MQLLHWLGNCNATGANELQDPKGLELFKQKLGFLAMSGLFDNRKFGLDGQYAGMMLTDDVFGGPTVSLTRSVGTL